MRYYNVVVIKDTLEFRIGLLAEDESEISEIIQKRMQKEGFGLGYKLKHFEEIDIEKARIVSFNVCDKD